MKITLAMEFNLSESIASVPFAKNNEEFLNL